MRKQRKMEYVSPMICAMHMVEIESPIMGIGPSIDQKTMMKVSPLDEIYSDGTESTEDYIIKF